jgi:hypothetical protein
MARACDADQEVGCASKDVRAAVAAVWRAGATVPVRFLRRAATELQVVLEQPVLTAGARTGCRAPLTLQLEGVLRWPDAAATATATAAKAHRSGAVAAVHVTVAVIAGTAPLEPPSVTRLPLEDRYARAHAADGRDVVQVRSCARLCMCMCVCVCVG